MDLVQIAKIVVPAILAFVFLKWVFKASQSQVVNAGSGSHNRISLNQKHQTHLHLGGGTGDQQGESPGKKLELLGLTILGIVGVAFKIHEFFFVIGLTLVALTAIMIIIAFVSLGKIPSSSKHPDDLTQPWLTFVVLVLSVFSLIQLNTQASNLGLANPGQALEKILKALSYFPNTKVLRATNMPILSLIVLSILGLVASLTSCIGYCINKFAVARLYQNPQNTFNRVLCHYVSILTPAVIFPSVIISALTALFAFGPAQQWYFNLFQGLNLLK